LANADTLVNLSDICANTLSVACAAREQTGGGSDPASLVVCLASIQNPGTGAGPKRRRMLAPERVG